MGGMTRPRGAGGISQREVGTENHRSDMSKTYIQPSSSELIPVKCRCGEKSGPDEQLSNLFRRLSRVLSVLTACIG
jgi:hypothetical protein